MKTTHFAALLCLFTCSCGATLAQKKTYPFNDPTLPMEKRIDNLLSLMTIDEKIDCLGTNTGVPRLGVMSYGNSEGIHGVVQRQARGTRQPITTTQFPQPPGMGASWDPELVREAAGVEGYEARFITQTPKYDRQILTMAHASQDEGTALAKVLFGEFNPGGHLVRTWPKSADQLPPSMDYNIRDGYTYMYFKGEPLFPFGYGLSYTTFKYSNLRTSSPELAKDGAVTVSVDVTNTGSRAGDVVVQMYVKHLDSKVERPREELEGFKRVNLQPNETKTVEIPLKASTLAWWDEKLPGFRVEAEPVRVMVGNSSSDIAASTTVRVQ
ncbi:MAG: fibronectin type III-like domain-contianing protein [Terracidiphilus sp.]